MSELGKVIGDMQLAGSLRRKLYYLSPILTAAAFDAYELLGLRRLRVTARSLFRGKPADRPDDFAKNDQAQLRALGFAFAIPGIEVFAYDIAEITDTMVPRLAALNDLQSRVHKRGHCSPAELEAIAARHVRPLVFVDIEGFEDALLDIRQAPALTHADIIVETHDVFNPGVTRRLIDRLWATHRFEIIAGGEDADRVIPDIVRERISDPVVARTFVAESRGMPELWLRFKSRTPRGTPAA